MCVDFVCFSFQEVKDLILIRIVGDVFGRKRHLIHSIPQTILVSVFAIFLNKFHNREAPTLNCQMKYCITFRCKLSEWDLDIILHQKNCSLNVTQFDCSLKGTEQISVVFLFTIKVCTLFDEESDQ